MRADQTQGRCFVESEDRGTVGPWALFLCLSFSMRLFMDATDAKLARLQRLG